MTKLFECKMNGLRYDCSVFLKSSGGILPNISVYLVFWGSRWKFSCADIQVWMKIESCELLVDRRGVDHFISHFVFLHCSNKKRVIYIVKKYGAWCHIYCSVGDEEATKLILTLHQLFCREVKLIITLDKFHSSCNSWGLIGLVWVLEYFQVSEREDGVRMLQRSFQMFVKHCGCLRKPL